MEQRFTRADIAGRDVSKSLIIIIDNLVYDVTQFADEHPGGHEVLNQMAGKDASEEFADIGHSLEAKNLMVKYRIGELVETDKVEVKRKVQNVTETIELESSDSSGFINSWIFPIMIGLVITIIYSYFFGQ